MNWNPLTQISELDQIDKESMTRPVLILKHSTRCSISAMALARIERKWTADDHQKIKPYYLDLLNYRHISDVIAQRYGQRHESPQVLVIRNGRCVYCTSHMDISYEEMMQVA